MIRLLLALAGFIVASAAFAAPVPKTIRPEPIRLSGPRPLMIRLAVVENGELKLTQDNREPDTVRLGDVIATDRTGKSIDAKTLTAKLAKPTLVVVTTFEPISALGSDASKVDTGDDWRRVLADDVIVIDGAAFKFRWEGGLYDVSLNPVRVDGMKVTTSWLGHAGYKWGSHAFQQDRVLDPDELLDVDSKEWEKWVQWNERRGVEVSFQQRKKTADVHRKLFKEDYLDGKEAHYQRPSVSPLQELAGNPFKPQ